ncbi:MAG TPA: ABC transporter permease [Candidatus Limnocylindrales bacterium]|jgi:putative ABC transport system permease protein|nr:ABC transporter permease [Candidatus Limnocylindrales bacterium]
MNNLLQDIRYAARRLRKTPGFTTIAVLTLALGIGANTAIFTVINAVLLKPLPFEDPGRLVLLSERILPQFPILSVSYQNYKDWREQSKSFTGVSAIQNLQMTLTGQGDPERLPAQRANANLFEVLGAEAAKGRAFLPQEDTAGAPGVVLISYSLWQRRFGGSENILGQAITLDNKPFVVVGILPPRLQVLQQSPDVMIPLEPWAKTLPDDRSWHPGILPIARLKPGVSLEQARAEMETIAKRLEKQYPEFDTGTGANVNLMQDQMVQNVRPALLMILGAVGFVLLIACTNVANLLLARATARQREIAVRTAIGASRWRVIRMVLTESLLLSISGAVLGLLLAWNSIPALLHLGGTSIPTFGVVHIDTQVLAFTVVLAVFAGLLFGLAPAMHMAGLDLRSALNQTDRGAVGLGVLRARGALVVSEVALAMLLLVGAGLLIRSFARLTNVGPGFSTDHILIADMPVSPGGHANATERMEYFDRVLERAAALPGVRSAGAATFLPVSGTGAVIHFNIQGRPPKSPHEYTMASYRAVAPGYLAAMGIPLLKGRVIVDSDRENAPAVVVINQTMANTYFPQQSPIGQHLQLGAEPDKSMPQMEIVGVVGDVKQSLASEAPTEMYVPFRQADAVLPVFNVSLVLRTAAEPRSLAASLTSAVHEIDANQPLVNIRTMEENVATSVAQPRFRTVLLAILAGLALLIAAVGIYGVMSFAVSQRTREIGTRMALGSSPAQVFQLVIGDGLRLTAIGVVLGLIAGAAFARYLSTLLFQVGAVDPLAIAAVTLLLIVVALIACYIPARRATRVDPTVALRYE